MEKTIQEKLDYYRSIGRQTADQNPGPYTPGTPDSLSTVIRTKADAAVFMAQLDALTKIAREEYLEAKNKKESENK